MDCYTFISQALEQMIPQIHVCLEKGIHTGMILIDFQKTFGTLDYIILLDNIISDHTILLDNIIRTGLKITCDNNRIKQFHIVEYLTVIWTLI